MPVKLFGVVLAVVFLAPEDGGAQTATSTATATSTRTGTATSTRTSTSTSTRIGIRTGRRTSTGTTGTGRRPPRPGQNGPTPLVVDLTGSGAIAPARAAVAFDFFGTGRTLTLSWVGAGAGFVALDRNGNGCVDDGTELMGNATPVPGLRPSDGFAALRRFDDNGDGRVDRIDAVWSDLLIWHDSDEDGVCRPDEMATLPQLGIRSLATTYSIRTLAGPAGDLYHATYEGRAGAGLLADIFFRVIQPRAARAGSR